jgi:hypothetical protein
MSQPPRKNKSSVEEDIAAMRQWQVDHERHDDQRQKENVAQFEKGSKKMETLATKDDLRAMLFDKEGLPLFATRNDVMPIIKFYNNVKLAAKITEGSGVWGSRLIIGIVATGLAIGIITGWFKGLLIAVAHAALK